MNALTAPMLAASKNPFSAEFYSFANTDFVVTLGFLLFLGILAYFKVPPMLRRMLDGRAESIRNDLDEAKSLREEAQSLLASYERKQKEVEEQAARIVEHAKEEAATAAEVSKAEIARSVERRLAAAEDQLASAQAAAVRDVRNQAVNVAIEAARAVIAKQTTADDANKLIDDAIAEVGDRLH